MITRVSVLIVTLVIPKLTFSQQDDVSISIESVIYWDVIDPYQSIYGVANIEYALIERYICCFI